MMERKKVIGLYIRVSTDKQALEGYSLEGQQVEGTQLAHKIFGKEIVIRVYVDEGVSGKSTKGRTNLNRMLRDVNKGQLDAIITYKVSRLSRSLSTSVAKVQINCKNNIFLQRHSRMNFQKGIRVQK